MVELSRFEKAVYDGLLRLGAVSPDLVKSQDQIMGAVKLSKGQIGTAMIQLEKQRIIKKISRNKRPGYYILNKV